MDKEIMIEDIIRNQRKFFENKGTLSYKFRMDMLRRLKNALNDYETKIFEAFRLDLGKCECESYLSEIGLVHDEINYMLRHLKKFMKPKKAKIPLMHFPSKGKMFSQPLGVCLIISPWNYPLQLTLIPLIGAIAGGNCAVVKPSRYSKNVSLVIEEMLEECFEHEYISIFQGGSEMNKRLLTNRFDHIFFTGSPFVGKIVLEAAAQYLTPVTLELGGKSPCIVDKSANLELSAKRIIWGKCLNSGQTCVAPDYLLVHSSVREALIKEMQKNIFDFYGENPISNADYGKIINLKHYNRLKSLLNEQNVFFGGKYDDELQKIEPTLMENVHLDSQVMKEEIFGPILPIFSFETIDEAIQIIKRNENPLALYLFTNDKKIENKVIENVSFGGGCINDTIIHLSNVNMSFGGIGQSGMGSYHGAKSFETFTHQKSIMKKLGGFDIELRYPPYAGKLSEIKKIIK